MPTFSTILLKIKDPFVIGRAQVEYTNVVRFSFNRAMKNGMSKYDIFKTVESDMNNVSHLDLSWRREAAKKGYAMAQCAKERYKKTGDPDDLKVTFRKKLFNKRLNGEITKEEYKQAFKPFFMAFEGNKCDPCGNRKFRFDPDTFKGVMYIDKQKIEFECEATSKRNLELIHRIYDAVSRKEMGVTLQCDGTYLEITYDAERIAPDLTYDPIAGRVLAFDMNPNYIGLSIVDEGGEVIHREVINLSGTIDRKRKHELLEISGYIRRLCVHYRVEVVGFEKLRMKPKNWGKGKGFNKCVNRDWKRELLLDSLKKNLALIRCRWMELPAEYSSFVGCMMYPDETDSVAASLELSRRLKIMKDKPKGKQPRGEAACPRYDAAFLNRWKKEGTDAGSVTGWVAAYKWAKKLKLSYRFLYPEYAGVHGDRVFRLKSRHSRVVHLIPADKCRRFN